MALDGHLGLLGDLGLFMIATIVTYSYVSFPLWTLAPVLKLAYFAVGH